ncbi:Uma2 family endonuclease [Botrimarina sp.]|uniref:Uma2 family endonuclease n=1 Tax=Botrimarina sp. TaxID=2795802 RepID=UPI0032EC8887
MLTTTFDYAYDFDPSAAPRPRGEQPELVWELATMFPAQGAWSVRDYLELTDATNRKIEYTNGRLEFLAMPTVTHQRLVSWLFLLLNGYVAKAGLGEVLPGGIRVYFDDADEEKFRIPDVLFLSKGSEAEWGGERYWRGVDLAIEVVSDDPKSLSRDYEDKVRVYGAGRVPEYWIVDPQEQKITVLTLPEGADKYAEHGVFRPGQTATSVLLGGFAVDVKACFDAAKK